MGIVDLAGISESRLAAAAHSRQGDVIAARRSRSINSKASFRASSAMSCGALHPRSMTERVEADGPNRPACRDGPPDCDAGSRLRSVA